MDFRLTDEQIALQTAARKYARERLLPLAAETGCTGAPPSHELLRDYAHGVWHQRAAAMGASGSAISKRSLF